MIQKEKNEKKNLEFMTNQDNYMYVFRKNIDMYAESQGMTLKDIAEKAEIPFATLNSFLYGTQKDCKLSTAIKLAKAFGVTVDELVGCVTLSEEERMLVKKIRELSERNKYLVNWFIEFQHQSAIRNPKDRIISAMVPEIREESSGMYPTKIFEEVNISGYSEEIRSKVFGGIKMVNDYYMPIYTPYDILLIANDRKPKNNEICVIMYCRKFYVVKTIAEDNNVKYVSIRDGRFCVREDEVDSIIGYVAGIGYSNTENS